MQTWPHRQHLMLEFAGLRRVALEFALLPGISSTEDAGSGFVHGQAQKLVGERHRKAVLRIDSEKFGAGKAPCKGPALTLCSTATDGSTMKRTGPYASISG